MTKAQKTERAEAITKLRDWIKPGDTVYTILDHVSASGMSRAIRVVLPTINHHDRTENETVESMRERDRQSIDFLHPNWAVGKALQLRHWKRNGREQDALVVGGCGMDMGFHLVYALSYTLYGGRSIPGDANGATIGGYACLGKGKCPSNYHSNHRDQIRCDGHDGRICWAPNSWNSRDEIPADWPRGAAIDIGDGATIDGPLLYCLHNDDDSAPREVCPTCKGVGSLPNPEGPERFDLLHTDGYALRHRWL